MKTNPNRDKHGPDFNALFDFALAQEGNFTTAQAAIAGYSPQLIAKYLTNGRFIRVRRGIYRLVHFPAGEYEQLTAYWLWSFRQGVFSHQTALVLHDLSNIMPNFASMTLPASWRSRRLRIPPGLLLYYSDVPPADTFLIGPLPVTSVSRTLQDCMQEHIAPEFLFDALTQAIESGQVNRGQLPEIEEYLARFDHSR
ncbi:MAG TPA: type IV toxin-antitoxin system AbiEi family antitoxin domain-containing protein [Myxococcota bacterium]|nr:type IV toxin-antitoxin system AbiEi family antitoxin domain-containing protein [Myxococcota bacterium]